MDENDKITGKWSEKDFMKLEKDKYQRVFNDLISSFENIYNVKI